MTYEEIKTAGIYNPSFLRRIEERHARLEKAKAIALREYDRAGRLMRIEAEMAEVAADLERAKDILRTAFQSAGERDGAKVLIRAVARVHELRFEDIIGPARGRSLVEARFDAYAAVKWLKPQYSLPMIGRDCGGKDHTTVMHGLKKRGYEHGRWLDGFPRFSPALQFLQEQYKDAA